jgi:hypothetical protein
MIANSRQTPKVCFSFVFKKYTADFHAFIDRVFVATLYVSDVDKQLRYTDEVRF